MANFEKVIRIIDELIFEAQKEPSWKAENALRCLKKELLKEREPIMIKTVMINGSGRNGRCQNCLMMLNEMDYPNFCGNCGQTVKWD